MSIKEACDVLIICGQGTFEDGKYYGEFHDRDVYFSHAIDVLSIIEKYKYNLLVRSGGFTQPKAPWLSEAQSFLNIWEMAGIEIPIPNMADEIALDSSENLLMGLVAARKWMIENGEADVPIRRIGIYAAWKFKKWHFNRNAESMGIVERFYFHGYADAYETNVINPEIKPDFENYKKDVNEQFLLRAQNFEIKRKNRWQNNPFPRIEGMTVNSNWLREIETEDLVMTYKGKPISKYKERFTVLMNLFPQTYQSLIELSQLQNDEGIKSLQSAFSLEIIK